MTSTEYQDPEWLRVGARVAVDNRTGITFGTIAKITTRDVVLDNGSRFRRGSLTAYSDGRWDYTRLRNPADPGVAQRVAEQRRVSTMWTVQRAVEDWRKTDDDTHARRARDLIDKALGEAEASSAKEQAR